MSDVEVTTGEIDLSTLETAHPGAPTGEPDPFRDRSADGARSAPRRPSGPPLPQQFMSLVASDARMDGAIDAARPLASRLTQGRLGEVLAGLPMGHALHPALMIVPVGCWTSAALLDVFSGADALRGNSTRAAARRLTGIGILGALPTAVSGWSDWSRLEDRPLQRIGFAHAVANTAGLFLQYRSWRHRRRGHQGRGAALGLAATGIVGVAGMLGGHVDEHRPHGRGMTAADEPAEAPRDVTGPDGGT
jgi:uncharacterized membrane protein